MKAYTLIEMIISVLLLAIVLLAGTSLFYQNLKSTGLSDVDSNLNNALNAALRAVENDIRYSTVSQVGVGTRDECLAAGVGGLAGNTLKTIDVNGLGTEYLLMNDKIASVAAETNAISYVSNAEVKINSLEFVWYCQGNISDKIKMMISGNSTVLNTGIVVQRSVSTEINLLNSGLN